MNFVLHGAAVSAGISIGHAHLVSSARLEAAHYEIPASQVQAEILRFDAAIARARQELAALEGQMPDDAPSEFDAFINLHRMILADSSLSQEPRDIIRERRTNAEWALVQQMETLVAQFEEIEDPHTRARRQDIEQVVERVLKALQAGRGAAGEPASAEANMI